MTGDDDQQKLARIEAFRVAAMDQTYRQRRFLRGAVTPESVIFRCRLHGMSEAVCTALVVP